MPSQIFHQINCRDCVTESIQCEPYNVDVCHKPISSLLTWRPHYSRHLAHIKQQLAIRRCVMSLNLRYKTAQVITSGLHTDSFMLSFSRLWVRKASSCLLWKCKKNAYSYKTESVYNLGKAHMWVMLTWYLYASISTLFSRSWDHHWPSSFFSLHFFAGTSLFPFSLHLTPLPLCCECSALPARPSPAQITAISFLLTIFFLSPPLFSWQNLLITSHPSFPLAALTCQHLLALSALNSVFPFFLVTLQYQMQPVHRLQPQTSPCGSTGSYSLCLSSASLKPHTFYALTTQNDSRTACAVFHEWIPLPKLRWHRIEATFQHM